jgi:hypothetical protein
MLQVERPRPNGQDKMKKQLQMENYLKDIHCNMENN